MNAQTYEPVSRATLRYYRCSAQKAGLVVDQIRGRNVNTALSLLHLSPKAASRAIEKLLKSAVANAEKGEEKVDIDTLKVGEAYVGQGPTYKRWRGRAFGRAFMILHRTCHITLKLTAPVAPQIATTVGPEEEPGTAGPKKTRQTAAGTKKAARARAKKPATRTKRAAGASAKAAPKKRAKVGTTKAAPKAKSTSKPARASKPSSKPSKSAKKKEE